MLLSSSLSHKIPCKRMIGTSTSLHSNPPTAEEGDALRVVSTQSIDVFWMKLNEIAWEKNRDNSYLPIYSVKMCWQSVSSSITAARNRVWKQALADTNTRKHCTHSNNAYIDSVRFVCIAECCLCMRAFNGWTRSREWTNTSARIQAIAENYCHCARVHL